MPDTKDSTPTMSTPTTPTDQTSPATPTIAHTAGWEIMFQENSTMGIQDQSGCLGMIYVKHRDGRYMNISEAERTLDSAPAMREEIEKLKGELTALAITIESYHHDYCEHSDNPCGCGWCKLVKEVL